ncbi:MAG: hypothetical protein JNM56_38140, partial [Planctomycetia bacterium]|nr:hypothetical protein [Planctomycetia bacterium]
YRDAALIYLTQLNDRRAAAGAYEAAGETDEALRLYRQLGDHVAAGDLLTRLGETDAALAEYQSAADRLAANQDWLAAGELLLLKAARHDLARDLFERGWAARPANNAVPCALRLARLFQAQAAPTDFLALVRQARSYFDSPGIDGGAVEFYHTATRLAESGALSPVRDEARDAALIGLATKLRHRVEVESRPGDLVSQFLGRAGVFSAAVVSDARHAVKAAVRPAVLIPRPKRQRQSLGGGDPVSAVCSAGLTGELFLAFPSGEVVCFRPETNEVVAICDKGKACIGSLVVDDNARFLLTVEAGDIIRRLTVYTRSPKGMYHNWSPVELSGPPLWVAPQAVLHNNAHRVCLWDGTELKLLDGPHLLVSDRVGRSKEPAGSSCHGALLIVMSMCSRPLGVLFWANDGVWFNCIPQPLGQRVSLSWNPSDLRDDPVRRIPLDLFTWGNVMFEIAGIDDRGVVLWSLLRRNGDIVVEDATATAGTAHGYRAVAIVHQGRLAAVTDYRVDWLRYADRRFVVVAQTPLDDGATVVAAFRSLPTRELLLVRTHGEVERLPLPPEVV